jgi:hypothetical protein
MAMLNFNATTVAPATAFEAIPAGNYAAIITESAMKPTKRGDGEYLQLTLQIIDGEHSGRKLFDRLNLNNPNATAVDIAQRTLSAICHAVGVMQPQDSAELHDIPMQVKVGVEKNMTDGTNSNVIKGYATAGNGKPAPRAAAPVATGMPPPQAAPARAAAPWAR